MTAIGIEERVLGLAESGEVGGLEDLWLELLESPPADASFYNRFTRAMRRAHQLDMALSLILMLLDQLSAQGKGEVLYPIAKVLAPFWPASPELRKLASQGLRGTYGHIPQYSQMIGACKGLPLDQALKKFEGLLKLLPGEVYSHAYWGQGIIQSLDIPANKIVLDFDAEKGKTLAIDFFLKHLTYLPPDSFLAMRAKTPEQLSEMAEADPLKVVTLAVQGAGGRMKQQDLKTLFLDRVIPESSWNSWWGRARSELQLSPMVDFNARGGAHAEIVLRDQPRTIEEEVQELFFGPEAGLSERIAAAGKLASAQKASGMRPDAELVNKMVHQLASEFSDQTELTTVERAEMAFLAQDLQAMAGNGSLFAEPADLVRQITDYEDLLHFGNEDYAVRALAILLERDSDAGVEQAAEQFPRASSRLAQAIWKAADTEHHTQVAVRALRRLLDHPLESPDTYVWAVRSILEGRWEHLSDYIMLSTLVPELIRNVEDWNHLFQREAGAEEQRPAMKLLVGKVRAMLQARNFAPICAAAEQMSVDEVHELHHAIQTADAFNQGFKTAVEHQLLLTRKDLETASQAAAAATAAESEFHWCTPRAREMKLAELRELNTVTIPANALEIEKARAEGDLKENAGYIYAKEKQKLLAQQSARLQMDLSTARPFNPGRVRTDTVGFGVSFDAEDLASGQQEHYTVLGRFETDPDKHIISYQSPFMQPFVGRKPGDEVLVKPPEGGEKRYRIVSISNALESGEWDIPEQGE